MTHLHICHIIVFVMVWCKLWPKQVMLSHLFLYAFTMFAPSYVVIVTIFVSSNFQLLAISFRQFVNSLAVFQAHVSFQMLDFAESVH